MNNIMIKVKELMSMLKLDLIKAKAENLLTNTKALAILTIGNTICIVVNVLI